MVAANVTAVMVIPISVTGMASTFPVDGDRLEVGGNHQSAGAHDHEHEIHQPEDRLTITSVRLIIAPAWITLAFWITAGNLSRLWCERRRRGGR